MFHRFLVLLVFLSIAVFPLRAQNIPVRETVTAPSKSFFYPLAEKKEIYKIAVLTPMYLDSTEWTNDVLHLPKFMMPGIDFYEGVEIAADTLRQQGFKLEIQIIDSRSLAMDVQHIISSGTLDSVDLILGNAGLADLKLLAEFARRKQINFVSAVSPSDASQTDNPYFILLQPRLVTHIEKIHRHIHTKFPFDNVVYVYRNANAPELNGLNYFKNDVLNGLPARFVEADLKNEELNMQDLLSKIDSSNNTSIILGLLDPALTYKCLKQIAPFAEKKNLRVFCMPTAESIKSLEKQDEFPNMSVFYTTSYIIDRITPASQYISNKYRQRFGGTPSEIVYKGFESLNFFANLMIRYGVPFNSHLSDNSNTMITPYKIMPVKDKQKLMFHENKFLYMIRYENGIMTYE